jgi:hypothetical protein
MTNAVRAKAIRLCAWDGGLQGLSVNQDVFCLDNRFARRFEMPLTFKIIFEICPFRTVKDFKAVRTERHRLYALLNSRQRETNT